MSSKLILEIVYNNRPIFRGVLESYPVIVGRSKDCDIPLVNFDFLSRQHLRIDFREGQYLVTDLNSSNGIYSGEQKIKSMFLQDKSVLRVGASRFIFKILDMEQVEKYQSNQTKVGVGVGEKTITEISLHGSIGEALDFEFQHKKDLGSHAQDESFPEIEIVEPSIKVETPGED